MKPCALVFVSDTSGPRLLWKDAAKQSPGSQTIQQKEVDKYVLYTHLRHSPCECTYFFRYVYIHPLFYKSMPESRRYRAKAIVKRYHCLTGTRSFAGPARFLFCSKCMLLAKCWPVQSTCVTLEPPQSCSRLRVCVQVWYVAYGVHKVLGPEIACGSSIHPAGISSSEHRSQMSFQCTAERVHVPK